MDNAAPTPRRDPVPSALCPSMTDNPQAPLPPGIENHTPIVQVGMMPIDPQGPLFPLATAL